MNANDSSNLIDSPVAGRLGPNRALLYRGDLGTIDKFRPYKSLSPGWFEELRHQHATTESESVDEIAEDVEAVPLDIEQPAMMESDSPEPAHQDTDASDTWTDLDQLNVS